VQVSDGRTVLEVEPGQSPRDRVLAVLGRELDSQMLEVSADAFDDARGLALWGLVGRPEIARPTAIAQHVFINGRPIRDRAIQHAMKEAYRGLMEHSRFPTAVLMIEMAPEGVDVNVHPAKAEVRFRDSGLVHSIVHRAVKDALRSADLTPAVDPIAALKPSSDLPGSGLDSAGGGAQEVVDFFSHEIPRAVGGKISYESLRRALERPAEPAEMPEALPDSEPAPSPSGEAAVHVEPKPSPVLQIHNSYVVTQDESGVVIVDQHALHERVMFEYLMERLSRGPLESQGLLTPEVVEVSPMQLESLDSLSALFAQIGIEARPMGPTAVGVYAFPSFLFDRGVEVQPFMADLLEQASQSAEPPTSEEALRRVVDMMSCKAAVKAGDRLTGEELTRLMELRDEVERSSSCPHGRPTSVRLSLVDLEKLFHRR